MSVSEINRQFGHINPVFQKMEAMKIDGEPMPPNLRSILMAAAWQVRHRMPADLQVFVAMKGGVAK